MIESILAILCGLLLLGPVIKGKSLEKKVLQALWPFKNVIGVVALVIGVLNITSVIGITLIGAGLVLAVRAVSNIPKIGRHLQRSGQWLGQYQVLLGILVIIMGIKQLIGILD